MNSSNEVNIDHEVRIRMLEAGIERLDKRFDKLDAKIDETFHKLDSKIDSSFHKLDEKISSNYHWVLGVMVSFFITMMGIFGGVILHMAHLI